MLNSTILVQGDWDSLTVFAPELAALIIISVANSMPRQRIFNES